MVRSVRVELNSAGVEDLLNAPGVVADLTRRMEAVADRARSTAPVETGTYRNSIHVEQAQHGDRDVVRVIADVNYATTVEANTGNLARALDAAGG
jgi:hypothetical protein